MRPMGGRALRSDSPSSKIESVRTKAKTRPTIPASMFSFLFIVFPIQNPQCCFFFFSSCRGEPTRAPSPSPPPPPPALPAPRRGGLPHKCKECNLFFPFFPHVCLFPCLPLLPFSAIFFFGHAPPDPMKGDPETHTTRGSNQSIEPVSFSVVPGSARYPAACSDPDEAKRDTPRGCT